MFVDSVVIWVASGKGGDGIVHMRRENIARKVARMGAMAVVAVTSFLKCCQR